MQKTGGADYKSMTTKRYERRADKAKERLSKIADKKSDKAYRLEKKMKRALDAADISRKLDQQYFDYSKKTSAAKAVLQNIVFLGPLGTRTYQQLRASGDFGRASAAFYSYIGIGKKAMGVAAAATVGNVVSDRIRRR